MRPTTPPPMSFFDVTRPVAGPESVGLDLGGLGIVLEGLDPSLAGRLRERYGPFVKEPDDPQTLRVALVLDDRDYFLDPPSRPEMNPVLAACSGDSIRLLGYRLAGWFGTRSRNAQIVLARGTYEPDVRAIENYLRAAVAWRAAARGGGLVHGAGAVWRDRGYLFYGASGAGKSTLSACNRRARIVSDDLSLILPRPGGGLDLAGSPFRGTYTDGPPVVGRFPMAAGFRILKAAHAEVREVSRSVALSGLIANLPWLTQTFAEYPVWFERAERNFASLPLYHLAFRKDDSYWDAIGRAGL